MEHNPLPTSQADQVPGPFITYQCYPSISILSLDLSRERKLLFLFHPIKKAFPEDSCIICICFRVCPSSIIYWEKNDRFYFSGNTFPLCKFGVAK